MKTTNKTDAVSEVAPITNTTPEVVVPAVPEYDGVEMFKADYETKPMKLNMNSFEVKAWFGENDPAKYFREGKIPTYYKSIGDLLADDREEVAAMKQALPQYPGLLLFKHRLQTLYTIVVPKLYGEFEVDLNGEIVDANIKVHTVAFAFGKAFEKGEFVKKLTQAGKHFESNKARNTRA